MGCSDASGPRQASPPVGCDQGSNSRQTSHVCPFPLSAGPWCPQMLLRAPDGSFLQTLGHWETPLPTSTPRSSPAPHPTPLGLHTSALHACVLDAPRRLGHPGTVELCFLRARRSRVVHPRAVCSTGCPRCGIPSRGLFPLPVSLWCLPGLLSQAVWPCPLHSPRPHPSKRQEAPRPERQFFKPGMKAQTCSDAISHRPVPAEYPAGPRPKAALHQACKCPRPRCFPGPGATGHMHLLARQERPRPPPPSGHPSHCLLGHHLNLQSLC